MLRLHFQENIVQINFSFSIVRAVQNSKSSRLQRYSSWEYQWRL